MALQSSSTVSLSALRHEPLVADSELRTLFRYLIKKTQEGFHGEVVVKFEAGRFTYLRYTGGLKPDEL